MTLTKSMGSRLMRLLGLDFETTGLDTSKDRITEMGVVLWDGLSKQPLTLAGVFFRDDTYPKQTDEIIGFTGITDGILAEFGSDPSQNLWWLNAFCAKHKVEYIVAHNGENFDRPLLYAELTRHGVDAAPLRALPWIDTRTDIPFPSEPDSRKLKHLALDCGFINPFAHRAVFDVITMLKVLSHYELADVLEYQRIPFCTVRALVSYDEREKAKTQRYSWERIGEKLYPKVWVKRIKENQLNKEVETCKKAGFSIVRIE